MQSDDANLNGDDPIKIKKFFAFIAMFASMLILASCVENGYEQEELITGIAENIVGDFQYPENPAKELRNTLENDINERGLPVIIGEIENIVFDNREYSQIMVDFTESDNIGVISFLNGHLNYDWDVLPDGSANPSFTIAFQDHDNYQDMIMLLTSVIRYVSPDLSLDEAERLAIMQDRTISIDGYSQPLDIGGYQIHSRNTNPHIFLNTPHFDAKLGVEVRAISQLWDVVFDTVDFHQLTGSDDYHLLDISFWDEERHPTGVYGDFIVKNTWQYFCWRHGCTAVTVDVESMSGRRFSFGFDTTRWFRNPYEFGVGQKYTLFIDLQFEQGIVYAVQRSESMDFNSRGQAQSIDALTMDFIDSVRVWPEEYDGTPLDVYFMTYAFGPMCIFTVLEGHGLGGETVWPTERYNPIREDYTFHGWFNNPDFAGEPYTNETPIHQETNLFPKWIYSGPGGIWPRAYRGIIHGIDENNLSAGQNLTITAEGYNMNLDAPEDKRFRWMPISWRLSDGTGGYFTSEIPFQANIPFGSVGEQGLYITYLEEVFDRITWQKTGQTREVRERLLVIR